MKITPATTLIALAALLVCSACADQSGMRTATIITPTSQTLTASQWNEATAAQTVAHVSNNSLISMR
jgi:hypothetical protein